MTKMLQRVFREEAIERLSSPEQLDQLVKITRPFDWLASLGLLLGLMVVIVWSIIGRIPTRVSGEGILISSGGRVLDAVSAATGRLASIDVAVGNRVRYQQIIAHVAQTETEQRHGQAVAVLREREHEHAELIATIQREIAAKSANTAAQEIGFSQVISVAEQRAEYLNSEVTQLESGASQGFITRKYVEDRRAELTNAKQRITDAKNEILKLKAQLLDLNSQRERERLLSEFKISDARRQVEQYAAAIERDSLILSPADGRVIEIKVSTGAVLAVGTPVVEIETEGETLEAVIYMPPDRGKNVKEGMEVRVEPTMIKREEYGALVGKVVTISDFPVTPQGMNAILHNDTLVTRFSHDGAPYAVKVQLQHDQSAVSGYRWTSGRGPPLRLTSGTLARAEVTTREQPPIDLVVPVMKRLSGIGG